VKFYLAVASALLVATVVFAFYAMGRVDGASDICRQMGFAHAISVRGGVAWQCLTYPLAREPKSAWAEGLK
jgi:hypothetical protein